jgi:hypothetical protein
LVQFGGQLFFPVFLSGTNRSNFARRVKRGRTGSHDAIDRILKHEPALGRAELWRRIRQLKQPLSGKLYKRTAWSPEDDQILRRGYEKGWNGKREAVRELLRRHPAWQPHSIWGRAAKLGLVSNTQAGGSVYHGATGLGKRLEQTIFLVAWHKQADLSAGIKLSAPLRPNFYFDTVIWAPVAGYGLKGCGWD